jgi:uncharacterized protein (DUF2062 family)
MGWSVAIGVFSGCTPFLGLHMWIALALATLFRLNRLWAFIGSRISSNIVFVWIAFVEIELAHHVRTGAWASLAPRDALDHGGQLFGDWLLGSLAVGLALGAALGVVAYFVARRWALSRRRPGEPRPPSSESRPSAPPAPTS